MVETLRATPSNMCISGTDQWWMASPPASSVSTGCSSAPLSPGAETRKSSKCTRLFLVFIFEGREAGLGFLSPLSTPIQAGKQHVSVYRKSLKFTTEAQEKVKILWKTKQTKRRTLQTRKTSRNCSFVAAHCSETTNKERWEKRSHRGKENLQGRALLCSPKKAFNLFLLFLL